MARVPTTPLLVAGLALGGCFQAPVVIRGEGTTEAAGTEGASASDNGATVATTDPSDEAGGSTTDASSASSTRGMRSDSSSDGGTTDGPAPFCGDGVTDPDEDCDDANGFNDDGCDVDCTLSPAVAQIEGGVVHTCARHWDGRVRCWGANGNGQLGFESFTPIGDDEPPSAGVNVQLGADAAHIEVGADFTCALTTEATVRCWGSGGEGQLGYGNTESIGDTELPSSVGDVDLGGNVIGLSAGGQSACAVLEGGALRCWGRNDEGQLGYGHTANIGDDELPSSAGDVDVGGPVAEVAVELRHACARLEAGPIVCWGLGTSGQIGYGNTTSIGDDETPATAGEVLVGAAVDAVRVGNTSSCALTDEANVRCWGAGSFGRLGYGNIMNIGDGELPSSAGDVPLGADADSLTMGNTHVCVLVGAAVRCWGVNSLGQLGLGHTNSIGDDEPVQAAPLLELGGDVRSVSAGPDHTCVRMVSGAIRCWGRNDVGQLGLAHTLTIGDDELPSTATEVDVGW